MKSKSLAPVFLFSLIALPTLAHGQQAVISVGEAKARKVVLAIPEVKGEKSLATQVHEIIRDDLTFTNLFKILDSKAFIEKKDQGGITLGSFKMADWSSIQAEFLIKSHLTREGDTLTLEAYAYQVKDSKQVLGKRFKAKVSEIRVLAHTFSNELMTALTGLPGIFLTKIAMSCDRSSKGKKEIFIMDYDGSNVKQLTTHGSIALAPAWSPDGTKLAYSLYAKRKDNVKNIDLYEYDMKTNSTRMLSNRKGINSGADYSPDGKTIAMTMSFLGNPEIFKFDPVKNEVTRLTSSMGVDVDPAWSPDGKFLAFVSSRTGMPMVHKLEVATKAVTRLTIAGRYNASPTWSPTGNKMGFAGWIDNRFDLFIMNPDGTNIERLTKDQGNNEDPNFSPDGQFLAFSSNRAGQSNIYAIHVDGTYTKRLTFGLGNCTTPRWSNPPKVSSQ